MKILNLVYPEKSDIRYQISQFPDGQQNVKIQAYKYKDIWIATQTNDYKSFDIQISSRLSNFRDLELIICTVASLRELEVENIHLYVPYFMGARSDRKFEEGGNRYLKDVICPIINSLNFKSVTVLDAHSYVLENLINKFKRIDNQKLVQFVLENIILPEGRSIFNDIPLVDWDRFLLVAPDAGASHKIYKLAEAIGYKGDVIICSKERDIDGKLTKTVVPLNSNHAGKDMIIIDDICDGGRTFINITKVIKNNSNSPDIGKIYLIVTHGIFSAGFTELNKYFDGIYCTNSYSSIGDYVNNGIGVEKTNVKQLNVF